MEEKSQPELIVSKMMDSDHFSQWLGIEVLALSEGHCKLKMKVRREMLNGFSILHGGISFSLADSCFAFASNSRGLLCVSLQASISYPLSAKEGDVLIAESKEISFGKSSAIYDVEVKVEGTEILIAIFRGVGYRTNKSVLD